MWLSKTGTWTQLDWCSKYMYILWWSSEAVDHHHLGSYRNELLGKGGRKSVHEPHPLDMPPILLWGNLVWSGFCENWAFKDFWFPRISKLPVTMWQFCLLSGDYSTMLKGSGGRVELRLRERRFRAPSPCITSCHDYISPEADWTAQPHATVKGNMYWCTRINTDYPTTPSVHV